MGKISIDNIKEAKFSVVVNDTSDGVSVVFNGDIDLADPSVILNPFFKGIHDGAVAGKFNTVVGDFTKLAFLNSSGIKAIAKWIMLLAAVPADQQYKIKIEYDKSVAWQATSLPTLKFLVPDVVIV
ncbi:MAG: hypothetical protein OCD02_02820 [Spirochaetaceae bacterium]